MPTTTKPIKTPAAKVKAKVTAAVIEPQTEVEPEPEVEDNGDRLCECHCHTGTRKPGADVVNWGFIWEVDESGLRMTSMIPAYAVLDGIKAARYKPVEMDIHNARLIRRRQQFFQKFGKQPDESMTFAELTRQVKGPEDQKVVDHLRI